MISIRMINRPTQLSNELPGKTVFEREKYSTNSPLSLVKAMQKRRKWMPGKTLKAKDLQKKCLAGTYA